MTVRDFHTDPQDHKYDLIIWQALTRTNDGLTDCHFAVTGEGVMSGVSSPKATLKVYALGDVTVKGYVFFELSSDQEPIRDLWLRIETPVSTKMPVV